MELYALVHLQAILKAAPDALPAQKAHAGVDFALLANDEPVDVDPRAIGTVQRSGDGCQIACVTWW